MRRALAACLLLLAGLPAAAAELGPGQQIRLIQSALRVLGHPSLVIDGIDGRKTRDALAAVAIALDWPRMPVELDEDVAEALNAAARDRLPAALGGSADGRWVPATADLVADLIACADPEAPALVIDGLVAALPGAEAATVLVLDGAALVPLPAEGMPDRNGGGALRLAGPDRLEQDAGDAVRAWRRCAADRPSPHAIDLSGRAS